MKPLKKSAGLNLQGTINTLKTALSKAWDKQTRAYLLDLLTEAQNLGADGRPSAEELIRISEKAEEYLGIGLREAARFPVIAAQSEAFKIGRMAVSGIDYSFTRKNIYALDILRDDMLFWVGKAYDRNFSSWMQQRVKEYFDEGMSRVQLTERIAEKMNVVDPNMKSYIALLADHNTTRVAEMGHVSGYEDAGIEYAEIVAVMDDRTSPICRHLHGRLIPVSAMSAQRDKILSASKSRSISAVKAAQPMLSATSGKGLNVMNTAATSQIIEEGIGFPPYHFRCRTTTVAHFEPAEFHEKAKEWAINGEVPHDQVSKIIGYAKNAHWGIHDLIWDKRSGGDGRPHPTAFTHYMKHRSQFKHITVGSQSEYNQRAMDLIRGGKRDLYLAIRNKDHPYPVLIAYDPHTEEFVAINLKGQNIAAYYQVGARAWEAKKNGHDVFIELPKEVQKWIPFGNIFKK